MAAVVTISTRTTWPGFLTFQYRCISLIFSTHPLLVYSARFKESVCPYAFRCVGDNLRTSYTEVCMFSLFVSCHA